MAQLVCDSVASYFQNELGKIHISPEQRATTEEFFARPDAKCLVVRRDDRSTNAISFAIGGELQGSSGDALVFVKTGDVIVQAASPQSANIYQNVNKQNVINETQLIANLREKLEDSFGTNTGLLNILSMMRKYAKHDTVS